MEREDARKLQAEYWKNTDRAVLELIVWSFANIAEESPTACKVMLGDTVRQLERALEEKGYRRHSAIWRQWEAAWINMKWQKANPSTQHDRFMRQVQAIQAIVNAGIKLPTPDFVSHTAPQGKE